MKEIGVLAAIALAAVGGCDYQRQQAHRQVSNVWMVQSVNDSAIRNAVIRQRTIYPYHFVADAPQLNELGMQELEILAAHFRTSPGQLSVRRGGLDQRLYEDRVQRVRQMLESAGVDLAAMRIGDQAAGGEGISGSRSLEILDQERQQRGQKTQSEVPTGAMVPLEGSQYAQ